MCFYKIFVSADILGVEFVEDIFNENGIASSFFCKLCDCKFTDPFAKIMHTKGKRHRFMYKVSHTLVQFMVGLLFWGYLWVGLLLSVGGLITVGLPLGFGLDYAVVDVGLWG